MAAVPLAEHATGEVVAITSSPTGSETPTSPLPNHSESPAPPPRSRARARRSPSRLPLRQSFRHFSGVVEVVVGEAKHACTYQVHKELLMSASPFFAAALGSAFAEGLDQRVRLAEEKADLFEWFLQWLYTGSLTTASPWPRSLHDDSGGLEHHRAWHGAAQLEAVVGNTAWTDGDLRNQHGSPKYFLLIELYALSDRLLTTPLSNHILSTIARLSEATNSVPTPSDTHILYDTIRDNAPLRTLVLDLFAYKKTDNLLGKHKDDWHPLFLRELVVKLKRPGPEAVDRHHLVAWGPQSWSTSRACEACRELVKPGVTGRKCCACEKAFCGTCLRRLGNGGEQGGWTLQHDSTGCKPWMGFGMCGRYHEHADDDACA